MCSPCFTTGWDTMNKNLREKIIRWLDAREKKNYYFNWTAQKKEEAGRASSYYFRNFNH
jgi:hypothetical protein